MSKIKKKKEQQRNLKKKFIKTCRTCFKMEVHKMLEHQKNINVPTFM